MNVLFLAGEPTIDFAQHGLDKQNHDDRLIASVIDFQSNNAGALVTLVTADVVLQVKSRSRRIEFVTLPDRIAKLPEDPDPQEKLIKQLQREVLELRLSAPA